MAEYTSSAEELDEITVRKRQFENSTSFIKKSEQFYEYETIKKNIHPNFKYILSKMVF